MQKVGFYLTLLVVGALIGASIVGYIAINQNPSIEEQVKVTIQGIQYETSDSVLKIELLNDAPEKNLEGKVFVSQDENQWTSEVTWYYTGYGTAEVICDSINETQNFRITYIENNSKATYLDRIIEWNEVSQTFTFMDTEELKITSIAFTESVADAKDQITVYVQNTGTTDVTIQATVTVTGSGVTGGTTTSATVTKGGTGTFVVDLGTETWSEGITYNVELLSSKGNKFAYTDTA
jgi:hypothetical protein